MDVSNEVAESRENDGTASQQEFSSIPFELVDDDEMAAIETALLRAHSVSSAYHSVDALAHTSSRHPHITNTVLSTSIVPPSPTDKRFNSFVYTVTSDSWSTRACREPNGSPSSQTSVYGPSCLPIEDADDALSATNPVRVASASDECSTSLVLAPDASRGFNGRATYVSKGDLGIGASSPVLMENSIAQGQGLGDSQDMEDFMASSIDVNSDKRGSVTGGAAVTLLRRKSGRGLSVTDFTASEWCEKQVEFSLNRGKPPQTAAMKAGSVRHSELEKEVVTKVEIEIHTREDTWAVRLLNFISGARQLLSEGLTRELPVLGVVRSTWVVGIIDEIRLVKTESGEHPLLVDTKTRKRRVPPSEPQKRNSRLQLMCYKALWDSMIETGLPSESFFKHFRLSSEQRFCQDVISHASSFWVDCDVQCLQDLMPLIMKEVGSQIYPRSLDTLLLRYEWQEDQSLLGEDKFLYEHDWLMDRWQWHLEFWSGHRAALVVPEDEVWKCRYCSFSNVCLPAQQVTGEDKRGQEDNK